MLSRIVSRPAPLLRGVRAFASTSAPTPTPPKSRLPYYASLIAAFGATYYVASKGTDAMLARGKPKEVTPGIPAFNPEEFQPYPLLETQTISHNTKLFRFALPSPDHITGLKVASCILTKTPGPDGKPIIRPYTPVSTEDTRGHFDLIIKEYPKGPMSTHIHSLKPGDTLHVKGPIPKYPLTANQHPHIGMIAGGTGITPMLQVIRHTLEDPADTTRISLLFANVAEEDILVRSELEALARTHPSRFSVHYTLDKPSASWTGGSGYVDAPRIHEYMPAPGKGKVFVCGPIPMVNLIAGPKDGMKQGALGGHLKELGYTSDDVFKF